MRRSYVIMNRTSVEGYQRGLYSVLPPCYFQGMVWDDGSKVERPVWTPVLGEAMRFGAEYEAWDFSRANWGLKFSNETHLVISVHQEGLQLSFDHREMIKEARYANG